MVFRGLRDFSSHFSALETECRAAATHNRHLYRIDISYSRRITVHAISARVQ